MIPHRLDKSLLGKTLAIDVAGAGGNGSQIITGLARMHLALQAVGHPGLQVDVYDPDVVSESNVGRQLFAHSDIGEYKARVLVHRINCYYGLQWTASTCRCDMSHADFLIGCVDSIASRRRLARAEPVYWLDLGNRDRTGQVILGQPVDKHTELDGTRPRTFAEVFPEVMADKHKEDTAPSCGLAAALERQDLYINQSVATFALQLLWSFIRNGETTIQGYFINLESGRVMPLSVPQPVQQPAPKLTPLVQVFAAEAAKKAAQPAATPAMQPKRHAKKPKAKKRQAARTKNRPARQGNHRR